jgi:hypothetical protein
MDMVTEKAQKRMIEKRLAPGSGTLGSLIRKTGD